MLDVAFAPSSRVLVLVMHKALRATVFGMHLGSEVGAAKQLWRRGLTGEIDHLWRGHHIALNSASAVAASRDRVLAAGGTDRVALDTRTGELLAHSSAPASPTAKASLLGTALVVPEGRQVSWYDTVTLQRRNSQQTPRGTLALAPAAGPFLPVSCEDDSAIGLWKVETEELYQVPLPGPARKAVVFDDVAVVATGGGAPERLAAVNLADGSLRWRAEFVDPEPPRPPSEGKPKLANPICSLGRLVIAAVATPAVVALDSSGHEQWLTGLSQHPTAFTMHRGMLWLGTQDRAATRIDSTTGEVLGSTAFPEPGDFPVAFAGLPNADGVLGVGRFGSVHRLEVEAKHGRRTNKRKVNPIG